MTMHVAKTCVGNVVVGHTYFFNLFCAVQGSGATAAAVSGLAASLDAERAAPSKQVRPSERVADASGRGLVSCIIYIAFAVNFAGGHTYYAKICGV